MTIFDFSNNELNDWKKEHKFIQSDIRNNGTAVIDNKTVRVRIIPPLIDIERIPYELRQYAPGYKIQKIEKFKRLF